MFDKINLNDLGKTFEEIQKKAKEIQEESENKIFIAKSGGGVVKVSVNGKGEVIDIEIDDSLLEDKESLSILLISAINDALKMTEEEKRRAAMDLINPTNLFGQQE